MNVWNLIETLYKDQTLEKEELVFLLEHRDEETASCLGELARKEAQKIYGNKVFKIDKVKDIRRAASLKVGGTGTRYTVIICGKESYLFNDENKWFVEAKV